MSEQAYGPVYIRVMAFDENPDMIPPFYTTRAERRAFLRSRKYAVSKANETTKQGAWILEVAATRRLLVEWASRAEREDTDILEAVYRFLLEQGVLERKPKEPAGDLADP